MCLALLLRLILIALAISLLVKCYNFVRGTMRRDKIEQIKEAREEIDVTLEAGAIAGETSQEQKDALTDAQKKIRDQVSLGKKAR